MKQEDSKRQSKEGRHSCRPVCEAGAEASGESMRLEGRNGASFSRALVWPLQGHGDRNVAAPWVGAPDDLSPEGATEASAVPSELSPSSFAIPGDESPGYFRLSLRDIEVGSTESLPTGILSHPVVEDAEGDEVGSLSRMKRNGMKTAAANPKNRWGETPPSRNRTAEGVKAARRSVRRR